MNKIEHHLPLKEARGIAQERGHAIIKGRLAIVEKKVKEYGKPDIQIGEEVLVMNSKDLDGRIEQDARLFVWYDGRIYKPYFRYLHITKDEVAFQFGGV